MTALKPLHELQFDECEDPIIRVVKLAKLLRIYDKQSTIILMERGFDLLRNNNEVKQTEIQLKPKSVGYLEIIRSLPDF